MQVLLPSRRAGGRLAPTRAAMNRGETGLDPQPPADPAADIQGRKGAAVSKAMSDKSCGKLHGKIMPFPAARLAARFRSSSSHTAGRSMLTDNCEGWERPPPSEFP